MDEFLCSLANYTEKGNPYHSIDAYPGTEFAETEAILKLFYPLIAFQFENGLRIILTNGLIKEVFGKLDFRYYLNYMILPSIEKYRNSQIWKMISTQQWDIQKVIQKVIQTFVLTYDLLQLQQPLRAQDLQQGITLGFVLIQIHEPSHFFEILM